MDKNISSDFFQGRREGVKGVTVSRAPGLKKEARRSWNQKKNLIIFLKNLSFGAPNFQASRAPKFSDPKPAYLTYTEVTGP